MSGNAALARLKRELCEIQQQSTTDAWQVKAELVDDNLHHWKGSLKGPEGTPYEGGVFDVDIEITKEYPFAPPKMRFVTRLWHPNVSSANGAICLDILKNEWSPALTIRTALLSLQAMLSCPVPEDPQDAVVARQLLTDPALFNRTAKFWTQQYAQPKKLEEAAAASTAGTDSASEIGGIPDSAIQTLLDMGFERKAALQAYQDAEGNVDRAVAILTSQG